MIQQAEIRPLVKPSAPGAKDGCLWCPLFPWCDDGKRATGFMRDAEKIRAKFREGHRVITRRVQEPWDPVDVLFVGESPDYDSDRRGVPSVGRPGRLLRDILADHPELKSHGFSDIVTCRAPNGRSPNKTEIQSCAPRLLREIRKRKPKVLVAMGGPALKALTGSTGINLMNGHVLDCTIPSVTLPVVACLHPAYVLRFDHEIERLVQTVKTVAAVVTGTHEVKDGLGKVTVLSNADEAVAVIAKMEADGKKFAFDTETGSLRWWDTTNPRILCFSLCNEEGHAYVVPWRHVESPWDSDALTRIGRALKSLLTSKVPKVAQNGRFDAKFIRAELGVWVRNYQDTLLRHYTLNEKQGTHGLDILAREFTGCGGYDKPLEDYKAEHSEADPEQGGSYASIPAAVLFPYAGYDADLTLRVDNRLRALEDYRSNKKLQSLATTFLPQLSATLARMEFVGVKVDQRLAAEIDKDVAGSMERLATELREYPQVRQFEADRLIAERAKRKTERGKSRVTFRFNPGSDKQVGTVLFDYFKERPTELGDAGLERLTHRHAKVNKGRGVRNRIKWDAVVDDAIKNKEWALFSVDSEVLHTYIRASNTFAAKLLEYREAKTLRGSFLQALLTGADPDGLVHSSFNPAGTVTGRLSSSGPNLQAAPNKDGGKVKSTYVSRFDDGVILSLDQSQIELRFAAGLYRVKSMLDVYKVGGDIHKTTAIDISGLTVEQYDSLSKEEQKEWRTRAKRTGFGCVPEHTEILTKRGWLRYDQVEIGDYTVGWAGNGTMQWTEVTAVHHYDDAPVIRVGNGHKSFETTPDHRWLAWQRRPVRVCEVTTAKITSEFNLILGGVLEDADRSGLALEQAELIGWLITDGSYRAKPLTGRTAQGKNGRRRKVIMSIYQSFRHNPHKCQRIEALLAGFQHDRYRKETTGMFTWTLRAEVAREIWKVGKLETQSLEDLVLSMGAAQRHRFLLAAILAEGHKSVITQNEGDKLNAIKLAATLCGYYVSERSNGVFNSEFTGRTTHSKKLRLQKPQMTGQRIEREEIGRASVWCVTTECGTWTMRQHGKIALTGNSLYGSAAPGIQNTLRKDGVFIELADSEQMLDRFWKARPELRKGFDRLYATTERDGYAESFTGRRRRVPEVRSSDRGIVGRALRQITNFGIQSGASDLTLAALVLIDKELRKRKLRSLLIITVHDSIVFDCPIDEMLEVAAMAKGIMENIHKLCGDLLPHADWSWLRCPLIADAEVGLSWGKQISFDPQTIQRDAPSGAPLFSEKDGKQQPRTPVTMDELIELMVWKAAA